MKLIFHVNTSTRSARIYDDKGQYRVHLTGKGTNQWLFPSASLSKALRSVHEYEMQHPRSKWRIVTDETDGY